VETDSIAVPFWGHSSEACTVIAAPTCRRVLGRLKQSPISLRLPETWTPEDGKPEEATTTAAQPLPALFGVLRAAALSKVILFAVDSLSVRTSALCLTAGSTSFLHLLVRLSTPSLVAPAPDAGSRFSITKTFEIGWQPKICTFEMHTST